MKALQHSTHVWIVVKSGAMINFIKNQYFIGPSCFKVYKTYNVIDNDFINGPSCFKVYKTYNVIDNDFTTGISCFKVYSDNSNLSNSYNNLSSSLSSGDKFRHNSAICANLSLLVIPVISFIFILTK